MLWIRTLVATALALGLTTTASADITIIQEVLSCSAKWQCEGDRPLGRILSAAEFQVGDDDLCYEHLIDQVTDTGLCPRGEYQLIDDTFEVDVEEVERTMLTCANGAGEGFCIEIERFIDQMNWTCTGSACYPLWRKQMREMENMIRWADRIEDRGWLVALAIGEDVERAAREMCSIRRTGDPDFIRQIVEANNHAGRAMARIQEIAGLTPAYRCRHSID